MVAVVRIVAFVVAAVVVLVVENPLDGVLLIAVVVSVSCLDGFSSNNTQKSEWIALYDRCCVHFPYMTNRRHR